MLLCACKEAEAEGKKPETDPAVAIIASRIGFASPADTMSPENWAQLVHICLHGLDGKIELKTDAVQ
jgi:hypothetical protein